MAVSRNSLNGSLRELDGDLFLKIRRILDTENCWRTFVNKLDPPFTLPDEFKRGLEKTNSDPAEKIFLKLCSLNMTVQKFVYYARQAQIHPILALFNIREPVRITHQPFSVWNVSDGESWTIELRATGSPKPHYQWFKDNQPIHAIENVFHIPSVCTQHSGVYVCVVSNGVPGDPYVQSQPFQLQVSPSKPLVIKEHPSSCIVSPNGTALLKCEVWGDQNVDYQWMRNGQVVTDQINVAVGSKTNELKICSIESASWLGNFCCRISRGTEVLFTQDAVLRVDSRLQNAHIRYTATDKVALLMGAGDYRSEPSLQAPQYDVQTMATVFRSLGFKVMSFLNLTKKEMMAAIYEFRELVGEGVYCVFYFCGHGFEASGQDFLLPPDAPQGYNHTDCLSADVILFNILLPKRPKICCMILDICRLWRAGPTVPARLEPSASDYFFCYGTSLGNYAFEQSNSGILVSHLKEILQYNIGVEDVFKRLREEMDKDPLLLKEVDTDGMKKRQRPEIRTTLSETDRSFHDPIDSTGYTMEFTERQMAWERAHCQPDPKTKVVKFPGFDVIIRLEFRADFSNELTIFTSVIDRGQSKICKAHVCEIPLDVADKAKAHSIQEATETTLCKNYVTLHDIQRLKNEMQIKVSVTCLLHDNTTMREFVLVNLERPLVSVLCLWKEKRFQQAEEVDEVGEYV